MATPDAHPPFTTSLSAAEVERIRKWHERAYLEARGAAAGPRTFDYLGLKLVVPPGVMPITGVSHLLGEAVVQEVRAGERVLDLGTGCGVNGLLAARAGAQVVAVDINRTALRAARANARRNRLGSAVEFRFSDVFSQVRERFDLIIFDPPFRWFRPRDLLEAASTDENYAAMTRFFRGARAHLTPQGRALIFFGTSGDLGHLRRLAEEEGFREEVVARGEVARDGQRVDYLSLRLTPPWGPA
jgi:release factor glutamine methyltransferase